MKRWWALLALVLVATAAAYAPAIDGEFVFDDVTTISASPSVLLSAGPSTWLHSDRPLTALTFSLNRLAVGLDSRGWHLTNVGIHLGAAILAFLFARVTLLRAGLSQPEGPALAVAALFALHPVQTESVAYITQRSEALASALVLSALLILLRRDAVHTRVRRGALLAASTVVHALALAAKPIAATLPAVWLLHAAMLPPPDEVALSAWQRVRRRIPAALPALALSATWIVVAIRGSKGTHHAGYQVPGLTVADYLATQMRVIPTYLRLIAWPAGQCADWGFPASRSVLDPAVLAGAAFLATLATAAVVAAGRVRGLEGDGPAAARAASFGTLFFFLALAPSSSFVPLLDPLAEHRVYLASVGAFIAVSATCVALVRRIAMSRAAAIGAILAVATLSAAAFATARRSAVWTTPLSLWSDAATREQSKARVHMNLGHALHAAGRHQEALRSFLRARALRGDRTISDEAILANIVSVLISLRRTDDARAEVERAIDASPPSASLLALRAKVEFYADRDEDSERAALSALQLEPNHPLAFKYLGLLRMEQGDAVGARNALRAVAATGYVDPLVYFALGEAEAATGNVAAACAAYGVAVAQPGNASASSRGANARAMLGCR